MLPILCIGTSCFHRVIELSTFVLKRNKEIVDRVSGYQFSCQKLFKSSDSLVDGKGLHNNKVIMACMILIQ